MRSTSERGVEVLRVLALSIRADQDVGLTDKRPTTVAALRPRATDPEMIATLRDYRPPYNQQIGFEPLGLRQALNKIAHADPRKSGFYADDQSHDLILTGNDHGHGWIALISLIDLCSVVKALPDEATRKQ